MEGMIFVGGVMHSGKSYFANYMADKYSGLYHVEGDKANEVFHKNSIILLDLIKKYEPELHTQIKKSMG